MKSSTVWLIVIIVLVVVLFIIRKKFKVPALSALCLVTGAVKSGKSTFSVGLVRSQYKSSVRKWRFKCIFCWFFSADKSNFSERMPEKPLLYSNIPLACDYVPLTEDLLLRRTRFRYGSSVYISEASLLADNKTFRDMTQEERIMFFNKLFGHETKGGFMVYDTQAIGDLPVVTRRCLSQYFYVHHIVKWIPFVLLVKVKEQRYSEDGSVLQVEQSDVPDDGYRWVVISRKTWKLFDCYCYSVLTDDLPVDDRLICRDKSIKYKDLNLKCKKILSFKHWRSLPDDSTDSVGGDTHA